MKRKLLSKASISVCVVVTLAIITAAVVCAELSGDEAVLNSEASESTAEGAVESTEAEADEAMLAEVSEQEESSGPEEPEYSTDAVFSENLTRLSDEAIALLDENVTSKFVVLYDVEADEVIYERNGYELCYPASTTKLLTAVAASSILDKDDVITVGDEIELIGEGSSTAGLEEGDVLTFEMLMDALMLPSGNDAAYTVAVNAARVYMNDDTLSNEEAVEIFMELVNDAAEQIGASETHFTTPDGWHDDDHYTTAVDLAKIAAYAKTVPIIAGSVSKSYAKWELISGGTLEWYNSNKLILSGSIYYSPYIDGMKTGFTDEAGTSVIASATIDGHTLIAVVMKGENLYQKYVDANLLFEAGFDLYGLDYTYG